MPPSSTQLGPNASGVVSRIILAEKQQASVAQRTEPPRRTEPPPRCRRQRRPCPQSIPNAAISAGERARS